MKQHIPKFFFIANFFVLITNISLTSAFFYSRWHPNVINEIYRLEKISFILYVLLILIINSSAIFKIKHIYTLLILNFSNFIFIAALILIEILFSLFPYILPKGLLQYAPELNPKLKESRHNLLVYLSESPWVKFREKTLVDLSPIGDTIHNRGMDFNHSWVTDDLGFKNNPDLLLSKNFTAIAIGDSFTEAMGIATNDTWASIVTKKGFPTYNLGVQGYAPQQLVGTLKFARDFKTKFIIFGYLPGFEKRSLAYVNEDFIKNKKFTGGIDTINQYTNERKIKVKRSMKVLNSSLDYLVFNINQVLNAKYLTSLERNTFTYYLNETKSNMPFDKNSLEWTLTKESILEAKKIASSMDAQLIILLFHRRPIVLYEKITKKTIPSDHYELLISNALKDFAQTNNIDLIDTFSSLKNYVDNLDEPIDIYKLPYFKIDDHMNETGQEIVAQTLLNYFEEKSIKY